MNNHTKGPWKYEITDFGCNITDSGGYSIIEEVSEADARLIAAAPELLASLEVLVVQFGEYQDGNGMAKYHAINIAKEVIAKSKR